MTRVPDLKDELVRAAARQDQRRRWLAWRPLAIGAVVAVGGSGAAFAAIGAQSPPPARDLAGRPLIPRDAAAAQRIERNAQVLALINRANEDVFTAQPRCRPTQGGSGRGRETTAVPPASVRKLVGALDRPASSADRRARKSRALDHLGGVTYINFVRRLTGADGQRALVVVSQRRSGIFRPRPGCLQAQHDRLEQLVGRDDPGLRHDALVSFSHFRVGQERNLKAPREAQDTIQLVGPGGGQATARRFATHGIFSSRISAGQPAQLTGLVPDGVASVTVMLPKIVSRGRNYKPIRYPRTIRRKVRVVDNLVSLTIPRSPEDAFSAMLTWRDARGRRLRVVRLGS